MRSERKKRYADVAHSFKNDSLSVARDVTSGRSHCGTGTLGKCRHASTSGHVQL